MAQALVGEGASSVSLKVAQPSGAVADISIQTQTPGAAQKSQENTDPARQIQALGLAPLSTGVKIARVLPGSAAEQAGLRPGDQILWAGEVEISQPEQVISQIKASGGQPLVLVVSDGGPAERVTLTPQPGPEGSFRMGAVVAAEVATTRVSDSPLQAAWRGTVRTWEMSILTFQALGRMIMGEISWRQISGPVAIADAAGQSAVSGFQAFLGFLAIISISIAVLNLLPIPMLDGGHLLYYLWELVRGGPLPAEVQDAGRRIGLALIVLLTVVALYNDFARIVGW
jgi:regulator of sigma E protease